MSETPVPYAKLIASQVVKLARLTESLVKIRELSTGWKSGNEGVHLLRINDEAHSALSTTGAAKADDSPVEAK